jgi:ribosome biogenesis GTPase
MAMRILTIRDMGYDEFFEAGRRKIGSEAFLVARVIAEHRGTYKVRDADGEYLAKVTGRRIFEASSREDYPAVGDWVVIDKREGEVATIQGMLPRKTVIRRKYNGKDGTQIIATNVDTAFIIESVDRDFSLNRLERYIALARDGGVRPAVILNKADLITEEELEEKLVQIKDRFENIDVITTSARTDLGLDALRAYLKPRETYCFLGSSGVGKSSLISILTEGEGIRTGEIGSRSGRGKHVTTAREMYFLENGGIAIDNPGMREVGMTDADTGIDDSFDEIKAFAISCRFVDCTHIHEPGCGVLAALKSRELDEEKYTNYINLKKEAGHYEMTAMEKRNKGRRFGKFIKQAKKDLKSQKHKYYGE